MDRFPNKSYPWFSAGALRGPEKKNPAKNRVFSRDVMVAMLVSLNKGTAAVLVSPTNPPGIELYYHANLFFCFGGKTRLLIT